jgi:hypothetical protein
VPHLSRTLRKVGFRGLNSSEFDLSPASRITELICTNMVYIGAMALAKRSRGKSAAAKHVRRSVTLPPKIVKQVEALAKERDLSDNRVLVELIEQGIEARQQKEKAFFQLAERFRAADDPEQVKQLGDQLGRFVFDK